MTGDVPGTQVKLQWWFLVAVEQQSGEDTAARGSAPSGGEAGRCARVLGGSCGMGRGLRGGLKWRPEISGRRAPEGKADNPAGFHCAAVARAEAAGTTGLTRGVGLSARRRAVRGGRPSAE